MTRRWCLGHGYPFTTSFRTRFPENIAARWPAPERLIYGALRRFHAAATVTMPASADAAWRWRLSASEIRRHKI